MAFKIRLYQERDLAALYTICLKTGDSGQDATELYKDPKLLGHLYAAPYAKLEPNLAFVLEDEQGVCGYILGALDSSLFYRRMVKEWLPGILPQYENPPGEWASLSRDEKIIRMLFQFDEAEDEDLVRDYPSHLHIDLLPRAQKQGQGKLLMMILLDALKVKGSRGVHLGLGIRNDNAFAFYKRMGFHEFKRTEGAIYMARSLNGG
ncbi:MAG: GNAT family N-acetyltransferase [Trueperaceae bacterium]|nr:GNAT family N-acetyltransferase [Trueperaceae bacterium]